MKTTTCLKSYVAGVAALACLTLAVAGCGGGGGSGPQKSAEDFTNDGWSKYATANHAGALNDFESAIDKDPEYAPGYLGAGWAALNLKNADSALALLKAGQLAVTDSALGVDFHAALALAYFEDGQFTSCLKEIDSCLAHAASYVFDMDSAITYVDLLVAKANAYFQLGGDSNLEKAAGVVHQIDPTINLDPENSSSWHVAGVTYATFSEALVRALERVAKMAG